MSVKFLSQEWAEAVTEALTANDTMRTYSRGLDTIILMNLDDGPAGDIAYYMHFNDGARIVLGTPDRAPDAEGHIAYADLVSLWKGEIEGPVAMMTGKLKVSGDVAKVMRAGNALGTLPAAVKTLEVDY